MGRKENETTVTNGTNFIIITPSTSYKRWFVIKFVECINCVFTTFQSSCLFFFSLPSVLPSLWELSSPEVRCIRYKPILQAIRLMYTFIYIHNPHTHRVCPELKTLTISFCKFPRNRTESAVLREYHFKKLNCIQ